MKRILSSVLSLLLAHLMYAQHAVDLGLSVLWADRNVGADSPGSPGIFVSWGELEPKSEYLMSNYRFCTGDFCSPTKYYAYNPDEVLHAGLAAGRHGISIRIILTENVS